MNFPRHEASLHLTHNDHLSCYQRVQDAVNQSDFGYANDDWVDDIQKQKAIDTNDCWTLQWYPDTPVGFYKKSAADLDVLLEYCCAIEP